MRKDASLPVRLDIDEKRRLKIVAERMGMTTSALIRLLVRSFVDEYERQGGRLSLPPEWQRVFVADVTDSREIAEKPGAYKTSAKKR